LGFPVLKTFKRVYSEKGFTLEQIADLIHTTENRLCKRINGHGTLTPLDVVALKEVVDPNMTTYMLFPELYEFWRSNRWRENTST